MTPQEFKQWRERMGLSQFQAAVKLGFSSQRHISNMETGKVGITIRTEMACKYLEENNN